MRKAINVLLTGFDQDRLERLRERLSELPKVMARTRVLIEDAPEFLGDTSFKVDVLIHVLGADPENDLRTLIRQSSQSRPILLIVHDQGMVNPSLMRLAMQAGSRDFIMGADLLEDTVAAVRKIQQEGLDTDAAQQRAITAVVSAKGGSGASTIASALSHALAKQKGLQTLLLDLDVQFGMQCLTLDLHPEQSLMEALSCVESLDEIALMGYVVKHGSGLHVLSVKTGEVVLPGDIDPVRLNRLIELIHHCYEHMVIDLPRLIDPIFNLVMERADHVLVVLQQDLSSLKGAQRMVQVMTADLGVPAERIIPILNRFSRNSVISVGDVERALGLSTVEMVPNDFKNVRTAANLGVPVADHAPKSPVIQSILKLAETIGGDKSSGKQRIFKQFLSRLLAES